MNEKRNPGEPLDEVLVGQKTQGDPRFQHIGRDLCFLRVQYIYGEVGRKPTDQNMCIKKFIHLGIHKDSFKKMLSRSSRSENSPRTIPPNGE